MTDRVGEHEHVRKPWTWRDVPEPEKWKAAWGTYWRMVILMLGVMFSLAIVAGVIAGIAQ